MSSVDTRLSRHLARLKKHLGWLVLSVASCLLARALIPHEVLRGTNDVGGNFLQTFGGIYGVIVAFAIYVTWGQQNETQMAIEREAVSLLELYRVLGWFPSWPERDLVRGALRTYALAVPVARAERAHELVDEHQVIEVGLGHFLAHAPADDAERRIFDHAIDLFHELNEAREHRVTVASLRLPEGMRWFVYLGGAINVLTLDLVWVDSAVMHALLVMGMTWVIVAATSIVLDLDDPYTGDFRVEFRRFHQIARQMEQTRCPALAPIPRAVALPVALPVPPVD